MIAVSQPKIVLALLVLVYPTDPAQAQVTRQRDEAGREVWRHCQPAAWPKKLPALDALLDSASLERDIQLSVGDTTVVLLSLLYHDGDTPIVRVLEPAESASSVTTSVAEMVRRAARSLPKRPPIGALRVRVRNSLPGAATVERSVYCPPEPVPGEAGGFKTARVEIGPGDRSPMPGQRIRIDAKTSIDDSGHVTDVELIVSSGLRELDEAIVGDLRRVLYLPAILDGFSVPSWVRTNGARLRL